MKAPALAAFLVALLLSTEAVCVAKDSLPGYVGIWVLTKTKADVVGTGLVVGTNGSPQLTLKTANAPVDFAFACILDTKGNIYVTVSQVLVNGQTPQKANYSWKGKFDGNDYPVLGDPDADTWAFTKVNDHELEQTAKKGGEVVRHVTLVFHGKKCTSSGGGVTAYYEKEHVKGETDVLP